VEVSAPALHNGAVPHAYTPFGDRPFRLTMGLRPLDLHDWIEQGPDAGAQFANKRALLAERHDDVVAAEPGAYDACHELLVVLADHVLHRFPDSYRRTAGAIHVGQSSEDVPLDADLHPIDAAGRLVQEDLCVLQRDGERFRLTAGSLCAPSRWRLRDKLGLDLVGVHGPVPGYAATLGKPTDDLFARLRPDKPVWRLNWSLLDEPQLFQPGGHHRVEPVDGLDAATAGHVIHLRVERQTLRVLPRTGAVVFTIRSYHHPLAAFGDRPDVLARLAASLRRMPEDMGRYKSLPVMAEATLAWLDAQLTTHSS
jgi:hypothetical protein